MNVAKANALLSPRDNYVYSFSFEDLNSIKIPSDSILEPATT